MLIRIFAPILLAVAAAGCTGKPQTSSNQSANTASLKPRAEATAPAFTRTDVEVHAARELIVDGNLTVDIMELVAPQRALELAARLQKAASEDPAWWIEHVKRAKPGEPLPYDSRCTLSKAEYDEFLALSEQWKTQEKGEASTLTITSTEDDVFALDGGESLSDLTGIEIDLKNDLVRTPFGAADFRSEINASTESALGAWTGIQWKLSEFDPDETIGAVVTFALGRLERSGRGVLYYDVRKVESDHKTRISVILNFDLPATEPSDRP